MILYSSFANLQSSQRHWLISSRQCCLLITVHSWHTSPVTCKPCWTGSQMPQSYLAWPIALERPRFFSSQHQQQCPTAAITVSGAELKTVKSFKYLWNMISSNGQLDKKISERISKANQAPGRLWNRMLTHHDMSQNTKLKVYRSVVLTSLFCGCESWTFYYHCIKQLEKFHMWALHSILSIQWQDKITNLKVLDWATSTSIKVMLLKAQHHWVSHVIQMGSEPKQLFLGELAQGQRKQGWQCKCYKGTLKSILKSCGIRPSELNITGQVHHHWCTFMHIAIASLEKECPGKLITASNHRHRATSAPALTMAFQWPTCLNLCMSRLALQSHSRVHWQEHRPSHPWIQGTTTVCM